MELAIPPKFAHHRPGARLVPHDYTPDAFNRRHQFAYLPRRGVGTLPVFLGHHRHGHGIRAVGQNGKSFRHIAVNSSGAIRFRPQNAPGGNPNIARHVAAQEKDFSMRLRRGLARFVHLRGMYVQPVPRGFARYGLPVYILSPEVGGVAHGNNVPRIQKKRPERTRSMRRFFVNSL